MARLGRGQPNRPILIRAPAETDSGDCTITRPNTGTVARPATVTTVRPDTGIIVRPCA